MGRLWSDELNTGITEIDDGNRAIVDHINELDTARDNGDSDKLISTLDKLLDHVCNQFILEEHMMQEAGYKYFKAHERVHEVFAKKLAEFRGRVQDGDYPFDDVISMLSNWLDGHVKNEDQMYASTVQDKIRQEGGASWVQSIVNKLFG